MASSLKSWVATGLGVGLLALWVLGVAWGEASWLTWLDGVAALGAFAIAGEPSQRARVASLWKSPFVLAGALFLFWAFGLARGVAPWLAWCTFACACGSLGLALSGAQRAKR